MNAISNCRIPRTPWRPFQLVFAFVWLVGLLSGKAADPTAPPPTPTRPAADVVSLYTSSGTYTNAPVDTWLAGWSQASFEDVEIPSTGRIVKKYSTLNYAGVEFFNPRVDATGMTHLHLDIWTPNATKFSVKLVNVAPNAEREIFFNNTVITQNNWISLDIPLSQFTGVNMAGLAQLLFVNNAGGVENGTFFIDNIYFYDDGTVVPPLPTPTTAAPVPTRPADKVQALFTSSATYPEEAVNTWRAGWSQGNLSDHLIAGSTIPVKKYESLNYVGVEFTNPLIDATGKTHLHLDLWTPNATKFSVKLVSFNPSAEREIFFTNTVITQNNWVSLDIPLAQFTGVDLSQLAQLLFINNAGGIEYGTFYIDNVYLYNDGTVVPPPPAPATAAPVPTRPVDKVKSLYSSSGTYVDEPVDTWRTSWSVGNYTEHQIPSTTTFLKKYTSLNYAGVEFQNPRLDASGMTHLHLNVWTPDATKFSVKLVSFSPNAAEKEVFFDSTVITKNNWITLNIPLSQFSGVVRTDLQQLLFVNNQGGVEFGTFFIDNVFFYNDGTIIPPVPVPLTAAPAPTRPAASVKALHTSSGTYSPEPVDTWRAPWSVANFTDHTMPDANGSIVKKYSSLNYAGVEFFNPPIDATGMTHLHLDLWTPDATKFSVKLVSFTPTVEFEVFFTNAVITQRNWVSLDIPLSQFTGVDLTDLRQLLFVNNAGGVELGTFYIDNVYFYGPVQTEIQAAAGSGILVGWTANALSSWQPQRSLDGVNWTNLGAALSGNAVSSVFDNTSAPFHRVLETAPGGSPVVRSATRQASLQVTWPTVAGRNYQVKSSTDLSTWLPSGGLRAGSGGTDSAIEPIIGNARFFRVFETP